MSSASRLEVTLSESAREFLKSLEPLRQQNLALSLMTFYKTATPPGSRALTPHEETERIWTAGDFEIAYVVSGRRVQVGIIRERR